MIEQLKNIRLQMQKNLEKGEFELVQKQVRYYLNENNVSINRTMLDALKEYRSNLKIRVLFLEVNLAITNQIGVIK